MDSQPIGLFDSGFGGLTVARAVIDLLPQEHLVYLGDTARYPFGPRPLSEVREFSIQIAEWLIATHNVKAIVIACNTASAAALDELTDRCPVPVIGVIDAGVRSVVAATTTGRVGVIGTVTTIASGAYQQALATFAPEIELTCAACPGFVEFVERGETDSDQALILAERLLAPIADAKVDALLLGCTHYPFLARTISRVLGRSVTLISSADETAFAAHRILSEGGWAPRTATSPPERLWVSTGDVETFAEIGSRLLGPELSTVRGHTWE